ncbi:MAG: hypothetical protein ACLR4Z_16235 [Butyricicoccaceae bacterium]
MIIEPLNHFMDEARALGLPVIHVRSTLRRDGADEKLFPSAWRMAFPDDGRRNPQHRRARPRGHALEQNVHRRTR